MYKYKENLYTLLYEGKMKLPSSIWIRCVVYKDLDDNIFSRSKTDFYNKFIWENIKLEAR